jgi:hypothetical protein
MYLLSHSTIGLRKCSFLGCWHNVAGHLDQNLVRFSGSSAILRDSIVSKLDQVLLTNSSWGVRFESWSGHWPYSLEFRDYLFVFYLPCLILNDRLCGLVSDFLATDLEARVRFPALPEKNVVSLERGPLSFVSTTEELIDRKVAAPV